MPTYVQGYRDWCRHVDLPERIKGLILDELCEDGGPLVSSWLCHAMP